MPTNTDETTNRLKYIATSQNGVTVWYDPIDSHAATHLEDTPQLKQLVTEVISSMHLDGKEVATHVDMGRVVGTCDVVTTDSSDEIIYGMRKNRADDGLVPFTKSRLAEPCRNVAIDLRPKEDQGYELFSAWIGTYGDDEPFPASALATPQSATYWHSHAFVYGSQEIIAGTETTQTPW